jgi:puromycin-sensitive aminopeptidase
MLQQYLGEDEFRQGVNLYLRTHSYGNTETSDLWDAIEAANRSAPVRRLMDSWIWQPGYPLVSARLDGGQLVLSQQRFTFGDLADLGSGAATIFVVPLHVRNAGVESKVLLEGDELRIDLTNHDAAVVVNAGGHGFVRVAYDGTLRSRLVGDALAELTVVDRYNLIDDAWNAVVAGRLHALDFLTFVEGFRDERELAVWQAIVDGLRCVGGSSTARPTRFPGAVSAARRPALARLGWDPPTARTTSLEACAGSSSGCSRCSANDPDAQQRCRAIFESRRRQDPELVAAATNVVARSARGDFDRFVERFRTRRRRRSSSGTLRARGVSRRRLVAARVSSPSAAR